MKEPARKRQGSANELALISWVQRFAPYGVITLDKSFHIQIWNHWMEIHSSMRLEAVAGKNLLTLFPDLEQRGLVGHFERALRGEASVLSTALHRYLLPLPSPLREAGMVHMRQTARIAPLLASRTLCGIVIVIEDVTQREVQAESLRRQHHRDEILSWALAHFLKTQEPRKMVRQLFFKIAKYLSFDTFFFFLRDVETKVLFLHTSGGVSAEVEQGLVEGNLFSELAQSPTITVYSGSQAQTRSEFGLLQAIGISALIAIPLYANESSLGLLCFGTSSRPSIAQDESELISTIAQYLATAIDREDTNNQLKAAQEQLSRHAQLLETKVSERTARLEETVSELETLSYTLAHDLKAPVRGMMGYCEILLEDFGSTLPPAAKVIVEKMARNPKRMEALIKDLLQLNQVSREEIVLSRVEIEPLLEDILAVRLPAVRQAVTLQSPLQSVQADQRLLQQVLANLVDNAIKFVRPQAAPKVVIGTDAVFHVSPSARVGPLLFSATALAEAETPALPAPTSPKGIRLWVRDEGIGIPAEVHRKIFGIFERGVLAKNYEGTGMGLAIVARAMQRMGGTFGVESETGNGSCFWLEFPCAQNVFAEKAS